MRNQSAACGGAWQTESPDKSFLDLSLSPRRKNSQERRCNIEHRFVFSPLKAKRGNWWPSHLVDERGERHECGARP